MLLHVLILYVHPLAVLFSVSFLSSANLVQKVAYLFSSFQSHGHCFIGDAIILGRVDCCYVSFVSSKFLFSLLASSA